MAGAGSLVSGVLCLAIGWAGFESLAWMVARRLDRGDPVLTGDPAVLGILAFIGVLSTLLFAAGILRLRRAAGGPAPRDAEWHRRRAVFGTPVRTGIVVLAYIFFGGPALFFIIAPLLKDPTLVLAMLPVSAMLLLVVGAVTYWWLRRRRYGETVCWVRTLPGVAGGRFEADVDCALPDGSAPVIVRLKNLVPAGKRMVEVWRMEESLTVQAKPGRTVVSIRLSVPRAKEQRFAPPQRGLKEWLLGNPAWILELEKRVPGIDFLARFGVGMADLPQAPTVAAVPAPPEFGPPPKPALGLTQAGMAIALSLAFGAGWLGYKNQWSRYFGEPKADWLSGEHFQGEINFWRNTSYPALIEMRCEGSSTLYRSDWKPLPPGATFQARSVMTPGEFARRDREYRNSGYTLELSGRFRSCAGDERVSATWLKRP